MLYFTYEEVGADWWATLSGGGEGGDREESSDGTRPSVELVQEGVV